MNENNTTQKQLMDKIRKSDSYKLGQCESMLEYVLKIHSNETKDEQVFQTQLKTQLKIILQQIEEYLDEQKEN